MADFGETLIGKKRPTMFIFDIKENKLSEVQGVKDLIDTYPTFPIFDENDGIIFSGIHTPH
jgi:hypothetical protein